MSSRSMALFLFILVVAVTSSAVAQTPDGQTPADEQACAKYEDQGARYGLCIAYCEAQDCDNQKLPSRSCQVIAQRFIEYSVKQGYVTLPINGPAISCRVNGCTDADVTYCSGREIDCDTGTPGVCVSACSQTVFYDVGSSTPRCNTTKCALCTGR